MSFKINPLFLSDGYKVGHKQMLARGTTRLYGTLIPRSLKYAPTGVKKVVSFGQQMTWRYINDAFTENFFETTWQDAQVFVTDMNQYLGLPYDGSHFRELHELGYLPIRVKALPEGIETLPNIPHQTFINTVDGFAWLTLYLETIVSALSWKPSTSATIALQYRRNTEKWVTKTDPAQSFLIPFMCHDFSARGLNPHDMITSGLGHATSFRGSDTLAVIPAARYYYGESYVCINSVNASEHSVSTTKIFTVGEKQMIIDWLKEFPTGILSIVADTFDLWKLITEYLTDPEVKSMILARDGKLVIRPDSGDPVDIICGRQFKAFNNADFEGFQRYCADYLNDQLNEETPHGENGGDITEVVTWNGKLYEVNYNPEWNRYDKQYYFIENYGSAVSKCTFTEKDSTPADFGVIDLLWDIFGGTINDQGYKVLDSHIGAIYGDSINLERQVQIYERLEAKDFASTNIILGIGSYTYQFNTRDTFGFAVKGSWFEVEEEKCEYLPTQSPEALEPACWTEKVAYNIFKDPITDDGTKKSLKGLQAVLHDDNGEYYVKSECTWEEEGLGYLQTIFEDGKFYNQTTLTEIRDRIDLLG